MPLWKKCNDFILLVVATNVPWSQWLHCGFRQGRGCMGQVFALRVNSRAHYVVLCGGSTGAGTVESQVVGASYEHGRAMRLEGVTCDPRGDVGRVALAVFPRPVCSQRSIRPVLKTSTKEWDGELLEQQLYIHIYNKEVENEINPRTMIHYALEQ